MVTCIIENRWYLRPEEYEALMQAGMPTKCSWWGKDLLKNEFIDYAAQIGNRIRGDQPFNATLELEPGEYMFGTGDYNTMSPNGRRCSQVFYLLVDESGCEICKKAELPSKGGSGPQSSSQQTFAPKTSPSSNSSGGYWGSVATDNVAPNTAGTTQSGGGGGDYFIFKDYVACTNDMSMKSYDDSCDACDMIDLEGIMGCGNCVYGSLLYIKSE